MLHPSFEDQRIHMNLHSANKLINMKLQLRKQNKRTVREKHAQMQSITKDEKRHFEIATKVTCNANLKIKKSQTHHINNNHQTRPTYTHELTYCDQIDQHEYTIEKTKQKNRS